MISVNYRSILNPTRRSGIYENIKNNISRSPLSFQLRLLQTLEEFSRSLFLLFDLKKSNLTDVNQ